MENVADLPLSVDNRHLCSPIRDQGHLGSCTSFATVGLMEFFENKNYTKFVDASEMYLYKKLITTDNFKCGGGTYISSAMKILKNNGIPPDVCYPYQDYCPLLPTDPSCDLDALNYVSNAYVNLKQGMNTAQALINNIKSNLAVQNAVIFGMTTYTNDGDKGEWYYPCQGDKSGGGHAMLIVGYDDNKIMTNPRCPSSTTNGAFMIRNSWGDSWGNNGYGWVPYQNYLDGMSFDHYTVTGITIPSGGCPIPACDFGIEDKYWFT